MSAAGLSGKPKLILERVVKNQCEPSTQAPSFVLVSPCEELGRQGRSCPGGPWDHACCDLMQRILGGAADWGFLFPHSLAMMETVGKGFTGSGEMERASQFTLLVPESEEGWDCPLGG